MKDDGGSTDVSVRVELNLFCLSLVRFASTTCFAPPGSNLHTRRRWLLRLSDFSANCSFAAGMCSACSWNYAQYLRLYTVHVAVATSAQPSPLFRFVFSSLSSLTSLFLLFILRFLYFRKEKGTEKSSFAATISRVCVRKKESSPLWQLFR